MKRLIGRFMVGGSCWRRELIKMAVWTAVGLESLGKSANEEGIRARDYHVQGTDNCRACGVRVAYIGAEKFR